MVTLLSKFFQSRKVGQQPDGLLERTAIPAPIKHDLRSILGQQNFPCTQGSHEPKGGLFARKSVASVQLNTREKQALSGMKVPKQSGLIQQVEPPGLVQTT